MPLPDTGQPRHRWWIFPHPRRPFPKTWRDWLRLYVAVAVLAVVVPGGVWLPPRLFCRPGLPAPGLWEEGGECVGVTAGPYSFDRPELAAVMRKIAEQNDAANDGSCGGQTRPVTVGALMTLTSREAGGRVRQQLEGIAAAQAVANGDKAGCVHPIRVRVGQMGADEQAATSVADLLADDAVAVVGMGLSLQRSADAAQVLAARRIPMVATVITAEGFDRNGSKDDRPDYGGCDPTHTYTGGVGRGFFYRVAYRSAVQIERLAGYIEASRGALKFIMTPTTMDDPYTCTTLPLLHREFDDLQEVRFDPEDPPTVRQSARRICGSAGAVSVFYAARASHLPQFLKALADESERGQCQFSGLTVVSTSDAARMQVEEVDPNVEQQRQAALGAPAFVDGGIRLIYTPLADPDVLSDSPGLARLRQAFTDLGFDPEDLRGGWAINGFDGMTAVAGAVNTLSAKETITSTQVNTALGGYAKGGATVGGAGGNITFDNNGNRDDSVPTVVRLCPAKSPVQPNRAVEVYPKAGTCP